MLSNGLLHERHPLPFKLLVDERPDLVRSRGDQDQRRLSEARDVGLDERFDNLGTGGRLLVVGGPGSGKTGALGRLGRGLLERARSTVEEPVPVPLNLAAWPIAKIPFCDWLLNRLKEEFDLPADHSKAWLEDLTLLLDGLDSLDEHDAKDAVAQLNDFATKHPLTRMVVSCRKTTYTSLNKKLAFHAAVELCPLNDAEIERLVASGGAKLLALRVELAGDPKLYDLAHSPLWLWMMNEVYREPAPESTGPGPLESSLQMRLMERYATLRLKEAQAGNSYPLIKTRRWLSWVAGNTGVDQPFFFPTIQPRMLARRADRWIYTVGFCILMGGLLGGLERTPGAWVAGALIGLGLGWRDIQPLEGLHWQRLKDRFLALFAPTLAALKGARELWRNKPLLKKAAIDTMLPFLMLGAIFAIISFLGMAWHYGRQDGLAHGLAEAFGYALEIGAMIAFLVPPLLAIMFPLFFLTTGMMVVSIISPLWLVWALSGPIEPREPVRPEVAVGKQMANIGVCALLGASSLIACLGIVWAVVQGLRVVSLALHMGASKGDDPQFSWASTVLVLALMGAALGFVAGLAPVVRFVVLRLILAVRGNMPWRYGRFLKYAIARGLLKRDGRGVTFIHEYLRIYFAALPGQR